MDAGEAAAAVQVQHSPNGYVEYRPGTGGWPVVLAAPHGGALMPTAVPDRTDGVAEPDWKSLELAVAVLEAFQAAGGESAGAPALVTLMLDRRKMDGNRARGPCCEPLRLTNITGLGPDRHKGNCVEQLEAEGAPGAWDAYHGWLAEALMKAVESHGFCLLLDLHGQSHRKGATELGYLLTSEDFLLSVRIIVLHCYSRGQRISDGAMSNLLTVLKLRRKLGCFLLKTG
jgi:N-formylglutamate amidohydrolase